MLAIFAAENETNEGNEVVPFFFLNDAGKHDIANGGTGTGSTQWK